MRKKRVPAEKYKQDIRDFFVANPEGQVNGCATAIGCSHITVRKYMKVMGIPFPDPYKDKGIFLEVKKYFETHPGATQAKCAAALGYPHSRISRNLKKHGVTVVDLGGAPGPSGKKGVRKAAGKEKNAARGRPTGVDGKPLYRASPRRVKILKLAQARKRKQHSRKQSYPVPGE